MPEAKVKFYCQAIISWCFVCLKGFQCLEIFICWNFVIQGSLLLICQYLSDIRQSIGHHDHHDLYHKDFSHYLFRSVVEISFVTDFLIQLFFCNFLSSKEILIAFLSVFLPILSWSDYRSLNRIIIMLIVFNLKPISLSFQFSGVGCVSHFTVHFLIFSSSAESFFTVSCLRLTPAKYVFSESLNRVDDEDVFFKYLLLKIAFNFNCTEAYISSYHWYFLD